MIKEPLIKALEHLATARPVFFLSELARDPGDVPEVFSLLSPEFPRLHLSARRKGYDYRITRHAPLEPYCLDEDETERLTRFFAMKALPSLLQECIEAFISRKVGRPWDDPVILDRLRRAITAQKDDYWRPLEKRSLRYTKGYSVLGYLAYHFPVYFIQTEYLLAMLARDGLLKKSMTILDIGTGPGVVPLAVADFWSRLEEARAVVYSIERSEEHIEAFMFLREQVTKKGGHAGVKPPIKGDITTFDLAKIPQKADLMVFSNVLNEVNAMDIEAQADLVMKWTDRLAEEGTILIIEPAEEATSTQLRRLSLVLKKRGLTIHSPCSFIWGTNCTPDRCWSFVTAPCIRPTRLMEHLAACDEPFRFINTDLKYSYVVLRRDKRSRHGYRVPAGSRVLRMSQIHRHVDKRINLIAAKMSENLGDAKTLMFRLCDGTADTPVFAVVPAYHLTPENEVIVSAPYGSILELRGVLVRHNPKHDAWNLLVSRHTEISRCSN